MAAETSSATTQVKLDITGFAKTDLIPQNRVRVSSWQGDPVMEDNNKTFTEVQVGRFRWEATVANKSDTWPTDLAEIDVDDVDIGRLLVLKAELSSGVCNPFNGVYGADDFMFSMAQENDVSGFLSGSTDSIQFNDALVLTGHHQFQGAGSPAGALTVTVTDPGATGTEADQGYLDLYFMVAGYTL